MKLFNVVLLIFNLTWVVEIYLMCCISSYKELLHSVPHANEAGLQYSFC